MALWRILDSGGRMIFEKIIDTDEPARAMAIYLSKCGHYDACEMVRMKMVCTGGSYGLIEDPVKPANPIKWVRRGESDEFEASIGRYRYEIVRSGEDRYEVYRDMNKIAETISPKFAKLDACLDALKMIRLDCTVVPDQV
jgi:hypothetical protein